jgi:exodeoxyribonuclease V gamma subunit
MLEAVLSARQRLVVLYTGRDVRSNQKCPPAVPVAELCDALDATFPAVDGAGRPSAQLTREHRLQPFDPRSFDTSEGKRPWSFDRRLLDSATASIDPRSPVRPFLGSAVAAREPSEGSETVEIGALRSFWRHPVREFLRRRLRIWLPFGDEDEVPEREAIEFGWVDQANLFRAALDARVEGRSPDELRAALRADGTLPLGRAGDVVFDTALQLAAQAHDKARELVGWTQETSGELDVDRRLGRARLVGRLDGCHDAALVRFVYGKVSSRDLLDAWIALHARCAQDPHAPSRALVVAANVSRDGKAQIGATIGLEVDGPTEARLGRLLALRDQGLARPLPFFPKSSDEFVSKVLSKGGLAPDEVDLAAFAAGAWSDRVAGHLRAGLGAALSAWQGSEDRPGEGQDAHMDFAYRGVAPFVGDDGLPRPDFAACALEVLGPVRAARKTASQMKPWGGR